MRFMVVEHLNDADAVYQRLAERGRMLPDGVSYLDSWVSVDRGQCFQLMEASNAGALAPWIAAWDDLADFEVVPVITSQAAAKG